MPTRRQVYNSLRSHGRVFTKQTITQVRRDIRTKGSWSGLLVPNNVNSFHFLEGWHLGHEETFTTLEALEASCRSMLSYMDRELGNRVAFYLIKEEVA